MHVNQPAPSISPASSALAVLPLITPRRPLGPDRSAPESEHPEVQKVITQLKSWAPELRFTGVSGMIEPSLVSPSRWAVRAGDLFRTVGSGELEAQIREMGGNVVPLVVRPCPPERVHPEFPQAKFEVLSGLKRLMASLRLELDVFVVVVELTDEEAARVIAQSNRSAAPPRPYEWGGTCECLLTDGVFKRQNALAAGLGLQTSEVSNALALVRLDPLVLGAFASPLELQYADAPILKRAWEEDPEKMTLRAIRAAALRGQLTRIEVLALLLGDEETGQSKAPATKAEISVVVDGTLVAVIETTVKGLTAVKLKRKNLSTSAIDTLRRALEDLGGSAEGISLVPGR